jgi:hypothetical protein
MRLVVATTILLFVLAPVATADNAEAMQNARRRWVGKKLWVLKTRLAADLDNLNKLTVKKFSAVTVLEIGSGFGTTFPDEFKHGITYRVRTSDGKTGWMQVSTELFSDHDAESKSPSGTFTDCFLTFDPKKKYNWPRRVWSSLEKSQVYLGMTKTQAKLSWGEPDDINTTTSAFGRSEQWVYGTESFLYFDNGKLSSIQN